MIGESEIKHLGWTLVVPKLRESIGVLDRLFETPDHSTTPKGDEIVDGRPFAELEISGASPKVEEAPDPKPIQTEDVDGASLGPQEARV